MFNSEEKMKVLEELSNRYPLEVENMSQNQKFQFFIEQCKKNLHILLCFSPIGENFRQRIRTFPSLINCTTINWYLPWSQEALISVSSQKLQNSTLDQSLHRQASQIFSSYHKLVKRSS